MKYEQIKKYKWSLNGGSNMNSLSVRFEIEELCKNNQIPRDKFFEVRKDQWKSILTNIEDRFITKTHYSQGLHWGWNRLKEPSYAVRLVDPPYKHFDYFIEDDHIWFIVEDIYDKMWIYEGESRLIFDQVIPELYQLKEYYLVSKKYKWIICEDHHGITHFSGKEIIGRIKTFEQENNEEIIQ